MVLIGNIIWFLLFGILLGLNWLLSGVLCCCTIIGIPFGIACFRIAEFAFFPFGKKLVPAESQVPGTFIMNLIWILFCGLWHSITAVIVGAICCCTIIGIPFGIACFNIAQASLAPLGKKVVPK